MTDSTQHPQDTGNPTSPDTTPVETASSQAGTAYDAAPPAEPGPRTPARPRVRMSTVVWGAIIVIVGVGILARALGADFDNQLALIVLLAASGIALVVTSIVSGVRRR